MLLVEIKSDAEHVALPAEDIEDARRVVCEFIARYNLGAGCAGNGWAFHRASVNRDGRILGTISYNGRFWPTL